MMHRLSLIAALSAAVLTGCQSVPTADEIDRMQAPTRTQATPRT